jgi:hypothetical protein
MRRVCAAAAADGFSQLVTKVVGGCPRKHERPKAYYCREGGIARAPVQIITWLCITHPHAAQLNWFHAVILFNLIYIAMNGACLMHSLLYVTMQQVYQCYAILDVLMVTAAQDMDAHELRLYSHSSPTKTIADPS